VATVRIDRNIQQISQYCTVTWEFCIECAVGESYQIPQGSDL